MTAALVALTVEQLSADPRGPATARDDAMDDVGAFMTPGLVGLPFDRPEVRLQFDPFVSARRQLDVAPTPGTPTVSASRRTRQLTAILIADDRPVAVIDGTVVSVGDMLSDGARITAIRADRVAVMERNGQHRALTMSTVRP
ncbi:MAG: hypothetical protein WD801_13475 [Gemmatimonadaceae bacterium]